MKKLINILFIIPIAVFAFATDLVLTDGLYTRHIFYDKDCSYAMPKGWSLVTDGKVWSVKKDGTNEYLWEHRGRVKTMYSDIAEGDTFIDSCTAKAFMKEFVNQKKDRMEDFK